MPRSHRSFGRMTRSPQRLTRWVGPALQGYQTVSSGGALLIGSFPFEEPATIMRTRGQVSVLPAALGADVDIIGAYGIGVVTQEAFAAGVGSIPEPFTDADWGGWYVWRSFSYHFEFATAAAVNFPDWNFEVDSKAMRKVSNNEVLVIIAESQEGAYRLSSPLRTLVKLT